MRWHTLPEGLKFSSQKHKDFVIDSLLALGAFPETHESLKRQKNSPTQILFVPDSKELGWFLSRYEEALDRKWKNPTSELDISNERVKEESQRVKFWLETLEDLKIEITEFSKKGVDFETLNLHVWSRIRLLVLRSADDALSTRLKRYLSAHPLSWLQNITWRVRCLVLEWVWGKEKMLFGAFEKHTLNERQDPAKMVRIFCGYCGSTVPDNNDRPITEKKFKPLVFTIQDSIVMQSRSSLAVFERQKNCLVCKTKLNHAYIHKVGKAVMAVLL